MVFGGGVAGCAAEFVVEGKVPAVQFGNPDGGGLDTFGALPVGEGEVESAGIVGGEQSAVGVDVGVFPGSSTADFGDLLAVPVNDEIGKRGDAEVAVEVSAGAGGDAVALGVEDVLVLGVGRRLDFAEVAIRLPHVLLAAVVGQASVGIVVVHETISAGTEVVAGHLVPGCLVIGPLGGCLVAAGVLFEAVAHICFSLTRKWKQVRFCVT